jgi:hypothetical protein
MDFRDNIKGWREAVEQEQVARDAAFLALPENIGPFEVMPMTLRHLLKLKAIRSPFITNGTPESGHDIFRFLWVLSPDQSPKAKRRLLKKCRIYTVPAKPRFHMNMAMKIYEEGCTRTMNAMRDVVGQIRRYLDETFSDVPPNSTGKGTSYYSDGAGLCGTLAREYGWSREAIMSLQIKEIIQYMAEIREARGGLMFNPSQRLISRWLCTQQPVDSLAGRRN